jgi:hypothetical protein
MARATQGFYPMKSLRTGTKALLNRALAPFNLEIRKRVRPHPITDVIDNPLEACSRLRSGTPTAIEAAVEKCVIFNGLSFGETGWHPFVAALAEYSADPGRGYSGSILDRYYAAWQPRNGLECLIGAPGPQVLAGYPPYVMHAPWLAATPDEQLLRNSRLVELENRIFGGAGMGIEDGYGLQGPVSRRKGELEYRRLIEVNDSIRERSYDRSRGDITVHVLRRDDEFRFCVRHGQHRAAALRHLGYDSFPVLPKMLVDRSAVNHWPQVYGGAWGAEEALAYFDHLFDFDGRRWAKERGLLSPA